MSHLDAENIFFKIYDDGHQAMVKAQMTASLPYGSYTVLEYSSSIKTVFDFNYFLTVVWFSIYKSYYYVSEQKIKIL